MSEDNQLVPVTITQGAITVQEVIAQKRLVDELLKNAMVKGTHYGKIPGTGDKVSLLKAGAEKICFLFQLASSYRVEERDLGGGHREYSCTCTLSTRDGRVVSQGVATCTTLETKYKFRNEPVTDEQGNPLSVPKKYWENRDNTLLGGKDRRVKKVDGQWCITERVENTNPADCYNTCKKIGKKRAFVDATITATAASDLFTQDVDDTDEEQDKAKEQPAEQEHLEIFEGVLTNAQRTEKGYYTADLCEKFVWTREEGLGRLLLTLNGKSVKAGCKKMQKSYRVLELEQLLEEEEPEPEPNLEAAEEDIPF